MTKVELEELLGMFRRSLTSADDLMIMKLLSQCMVLTKLKGMDQDDTKLMMSAFRDKLRDFPADAVSDALQAWPEHSTFFPSWHELHAAIVSRCWKRRTVYERLTYAYSQRFEEN